MQSLSLHKNENLSLPLHDLALFSSCVFTFTEIELYSGTDSPGKLAALYVKAKLDLICLNEFAGKSRS